MTGLVSSIYRQRQICTFTCLLMLAATGLFGCPSTSVPESDTGDDDAGMVDGGTDVGVDGGDTDGGDTGGETCDPLPSVNEGLCSVQPGSGTHVVVRGTILSPDGPIRNGAIAFDKSEENARISCVGCDCSNQPEFSDPTVVTCPDGVISPGLMNPHDHLGWATRGPWDGGMTRYSHRHEWRTGANGKPEINTPSGDYNRSSVLYGELRHLLGGATSIAGSTRGNTPQGLLRNLDTPEATGGVSVTVDYSTFPLGDIDGTMLTDSCGYSWDDSSTVLNNSIYLPHIAEGIDPAAKNEFRCLSTFQNAARDLVEGNTSIVHGIGVSGEDVYTAAAEGAQLVWSPRTNIALYGQTAPVATYEFYGVPIALGTDWPISGSMNMLRELSCASRLNETRYNNLFTDRELWEMATKNAAIALGVPDRLGSIRTGFIADIAIFNGRDAQNPYRAVIEADSKDIQLVTRGGTPLFGAQDLVTAATDSGGNGPACGSLQVCGQTRSVCVERDTGETDAGAVTLSDIQNAAASNAYPLFSCGSGELEEPTCVPQRPGQYDGSTTENDPDGDGIQSSEDSCPQIFNPVRPINPSQQPDADDDGVGDACDPCPLDAEDGCSRSDWDGDGEPNDEDNCPYIANRAQADGDEDGVGDACDPSTTLYNINGGSHQVGEEVAVQDVVVTAVNETDNGTGFFVQVPTDASRYDGAQESGAYVFMGDTAAAPDRGDLVSFKGRLTDFFGLQRIENLTELTIEETGHEIPEPVTVQPCEVATGGSLTEPYIGVLLEVSDVTVTNENPDAGQGDFGEFAVGSCGMRTGLRVDDLMYAVTPDPTEGESFATITGPLYYSFDNFKLVPRDENDVVAGAARLKSLSPSKVFIREGSNQQPTIPPLTVTLTRSTPQMTTVHLTYPNSGVVSGPATVTVPANSTETTVPLTGVTAGSSPTDTAVVEADTGAQDVKSADVLVYDDALPRSPTSLTFNNQIVNPGATVTATVTLDVPAASGDTVVSLSTGSDASLPGSVTVPADTLETTFQFQAGSMTATKNITASISGRSVTSAIDVTSGSTGDCLILSEYIEGSGSYNKAIELYNCGGTQIDASNVGVCIVYNNNTTCGDEASLSGPMLQPGDVYTVCRSDQNSTSGDPISAISNNCSEALNQTILFNGNDRIIIFDDVNSNGQYDNSTDTVYDQFGQPGTPPSGSPWKDKNLRRCDLTPYQGAMPFNYMDYFTEHAATNGSHYGTAPSAGVTCP